MRASALRRVVGAWEASGRREAGVEEDSRVRARPRPGLLLLTPVAALSPAPRRKKASLASKADPLPPKPADVADVVLGIDPDSGGALAVFSRASPSSPHTFDAVHDVPTTQVMVGRTLRRRPDPAALAAVVGDAAAAARGAGRTVEAALERPSPNHINGKLSWYSAGYTFGLWSGALAAHGVRTTLVTPRAWKSESGLDGTDKEASRVRALAVVGGDAAASLARKKDHGRAEAMLIALWRANGGGGAEVVAPEPEDEPSDGDDGSGGGAGEPVGGGAR